METVWVPSSVGTVTRPPSVALEREMGTSMWTSYPSRVNRWCCATCVGR